MLPPAGSAWLPVSTLIVFLAVQWWATWYPGAEPGGGGYVAQRILAAKDERHGLLATLWFQIAHYALRPWPWILVGFVALIRYPGLANPEEGYVRVMVDVLPSPMKGLLLATFAAAYMSTVGTHLNWGASYLVNDVYLRFINPNAGRKSQVIASGVATVTLMLLSLVVMALLSSVEQGWKILIGLGAGTGLVYILRWYWWRINAWSEISAMIASFVAAVTLHFMGVDAADTSSGDYAIAMLISVAVATVTWVTVTLLTPPEPDPVLDTLLPPGPTGRARLAPRRPAAGLPERPDPRGRALLGQLGGGCRGRIHLPLRAGGPPDRPAARRAGLRGGGGCGFRVDTAQLTPRDADLCAG